MGFKEELNRVHSIHNEKGFIDYNDVIDLNKERSKSMLQSLILKTPYPIKSEIILTPDLLAVLYIAPPFELLEIPANTLF